MNACLPARTLRARAHPAPVGPAARLHVCCRRSRWPASLLSNRTRRRRAPQVRVKMVISDDDMTTDIIVEADQEEIARMAKVGAPMTRGPGASHCSGQAPARALAKRAQRCAGSIGCIRLLQCAV